MAIYFNAMIVCERCDAELRMDDVETESEVERRLISSESKWAVDEDGDMVCGDCWAKWDAKQRSAQAQSADAVARSVEASTV